MTSLNLLVGYGSDDSNISETTEIIELPESEEPAKANNFFQVVDDSSSGDEDQTDDFSLQDENSRNLKNPFRTAEASMTAQSVFANPYKEAEDAEKVTLEKHVKFSPKLEDVKEINGRKICWNYRKGRCRFGSNCVFAHDSELLLKKEKQELDPLQHSIQSADFDNSTGDPTKSRNAKYLIKRHCTADQASNQSQKKPRLHQQH